MFLSLCVIYETQKYSLDLIHAKHSKQHHHSRQAARKHGLYAANRFSVRAYLRLMAALLVRLEMVVEKDVQLPYFVGIIFISPILDDGSKIVSP